MSQEYKYVIVDDEPKAIELLKKRISLLFPNLSNIGVYTGWSEAVDPLRTNKPDIVFLDISMPEKSGIDFLKLFPDRKFDVIFVTAHADYAIDAIKLSAVGYILKPIDDTELYHAVNKVIEKKNSISRSNITDINGDVLKIGVPNINGVDYIKPEEILYFESVNKYTKVVTKSYSVVSSYNLGEFKKVISDESFFQVHRSFIVNLHHIRRYEAAGTVVMDDDMQIPVSKNSKSEFHERFGKISRIAGGKSSK